MTEHIVGINEEALTQQCHCGLVAIRQFTPGIGRMLTLEESSTKLIHNLEVLGPNGESTGPVRVSSENERRRAMKRARVREVTAADFDKLRFRDRAKNKPKRWF